MNSDELQLFNMIDNARVNNGCARLEQDPGLTDGARGDASSRADSGAVNSTSGGSNTTAGGDNWNAQQAFNQMMAQSKSTVLNCGLKTLGVGKDTAKYCKGGLLGTCLGASRPTRVAWVADFS
jgi:hypothetical protein